MTIALILTAYLSGLTAKSLQLPPLIGYLLAGFALHYMGFELNGDLQQIADLGITLMLFTIGLKINVRELFAIHVWGTACTHMSVWMVACFVINAVCGALGLLLFDLTVSQTALVIFALSFSSTVCVIKVLEESGELKSRQGSIAVGVLIIQDLIAVGFLVAVTGKLPDIWAVALLALPLLKPVIDRLLVKTGHGELLPLAGLMLALGAYALFESVNVKGDLGALIVGMIVATSRKSSELYKSLITFKDIFLIAFFLSIGLTALPDMYMLGIATLLLLLLPLKFLLFYGLFVAMAFRARTAFLASLLLGNFSEFGLIVGALSIKEGLLSEEWLIVLAITTAQSFVITSLIYKRAHTIYARLSPVLQKYQRAKAEELARPDSIGDVDVVLVGMGRVGFGAYSSFVKSQDLKICGIEVDQKRVLEHRAQGIENVIQGDADDCEFWEAQDLSSVRMIMLALPNVEEMTNIIGQLQLVGYQGSIAAVAQHEDERKHLLQCGVDVAFNYYQEVGNGFADESRHLLDGHS